MARTLPELEAEIRDLKGRLDAEIRRRQAAEADLKDARDTVKAALKQMPVLVLAGDEDGDIVFYNEEFRRVTGYSDQEILNDPKAMNLLDPDRWDDAPSDGGASDEWHIRCKDGSEKIIAWSSVSNHFPIRGWTAWKVGVDITPLKRLETERLAREKLQGVLEMAGAVCHELNQPLQVVSGYGELIEMELQRDHPLRELLDKLREQVGKMAGITRQLMRITRYETKDYLGGKIIDIDGASR